MYGRVDALRTPCSDWWRKGRAAALVVLLVAVAAVPNAEAYDCLEPIGRWSRGPSYAAAADQDFAYFGAGGGLVIAELTDAGTIRIVAEMPIAVRPQNLHDIEVEGNTLVAAFGELMQMVDLSDPALPESTSLWTSPDRIHDVVLTDGYAYVAAGSAGLLVIDLLAADGPAEVGSLHSGSPAKRLDIADNLLYLSDNQSILRVIDVSTPSAPVELGFVADPAHQARGISVDGSYAYVADGFGLHVVDVADPAAPTTVSFLDVPGNLKAVTKAGGYVYVSADSYGMRVIDVSDPTTPVEVGAFDPGYVQEVAAVDGTAWLTDPYFGARAVDISVPTAPRLNASVRTRIRAITVAVVGQDAYLMGEGRGLRILDLSRPGSPVEVGFCSTVDYPEDVVVHDDLAFVIGDGLSVIDVADPTAPEEVGTLPVFGVALDLADDHLYVAGGTTGLRVIDVSMPSEPIEIAVVDDFEVCGLSVTQGLAYVTDFDFGLRIFDVGDPANPAEVGAVATAGYPTDVALEGDLAFVATGGEGVRIIDVSSPSDPIEVAVVPEQGSGSRKAVSVAVEGVYAYVGIIEEGMWGDVNRSVTVYGLANLSAPIELGEVEFGNQGYPKVEVTDGRLFVPVGMYGLEIYASCALPPPRRTGGRIGG